MNVDELERLLAAWQRGCAEFNRGMYWDAHEHWEQGWTRLPPAPKLQVQGLIQLAAVFVHLENERPAPAARLCRSALLKLERARAQGRGMFPIWLAVPGAGPALRRLSRAPAEWRNIARALQARVILRKPVARSRARS